MKSMCILGLMTERGNEEGGKTKHYGGGGGYLRSFRRTAMSHCLHHSSLENMPDQVGQAQSDYR